MRLEHWPVAVIEFTKILYSIIYLDWCLLHSVFFDPTGNHFLQGTVIKQKVTTWLLTEATCSLASQSTWND